MVRGALESGNVNAALNELSYSELYYLADEIDADTELAYQGTRTERLRSIERELWTSGVDEQTFRTEINNVVGILALSHWGSRDLEDIEVLPLDRNDYSDHMQAERLSAEFVVRLIDLCQQEKISPAVQPMLIFRAIRHLYENADDSITVEQNIARTLTRENLRTWVEDLVNEGMIRDDGEPMTGKERLPIEQIYEERIPVNELAHYIDIPAGIEPVRFNDFHVLYGYMFVGILGFTRRKKRLEEFRKRMLERLSSSEDDEEIDNILTQISKRPDLFVGPQVLESLSENPAFKNEANKLLEHYGLLEVAQKREPPDEIEVTEEIASIPELISPPEVKTAPKKLLERARSFLKQSFKSAAGIKALVYGAAAGFQVGLYFFLNYLMKFRSDVHTLFTSLDTSIPLIPETSWMYIMLYPVYFLPLFVFRKMRDFFLFIGAYMTTVLVAFTAYITYPVKMIRPDIEVDSLSTWLLSLIYAVDNPYNSMPSLHVAIPFLLAFAVRKTRRALGTFLLFAATMIGLSILTVKQHYVVDFVTGLALAVFSYKLWFDWMKGWLAKRFKLFRAEEEKEKIAVPEKTEFFPPESPGTRLDRIQRSAEQTGKAA
jgi:membrane-associated phospholipid phosphatase